MKYDISTIYTNICREARRLRESESDIILQDIDLYADTLEGMAWALAEMESYPSGGEKPMEEDTKKALKTACSLLKRDKVDALDRAIHAAFGQEAASL